MVDVVQVISDAFSTYREKWREVIVPFLVLFAIAFVFGLASFGLSMTRQFACDSDNPYILLGLCLAPQIVQMLMAMVESFVGLVVIMAVLFPLWELAQGKKASVWTEYLGPQLFNAIKVILLRLALTIIAALPIVIFVVLEIGIIIATLKAGGGLGGILAMGSIFVFLLVILVTVVLMMVINFLLTFLEIEVVINRRGVIAAMRASYERVVSNLLGVFLFNVVWWLLGLGVGILTLALVCTLCLAPIGWMISPLIVTPVMWISRLLLWKELGGAKAKKA